MKDRGNALAVAVIRSKTRLTIEQLAQKAGYKRTSYYKHIKNPNLKDHVLIAYGKILNYDFTEDFPNMPKYMEKETLVVEPEPDYGIPLTKEEAIRRLGISKQREDMWKDKYIEQLEDNKRMRDEMEKRKRKK